jgi:hypothetical protein
MLVSMSFCQGGGLLSRPLNQGGSESFKGPGGSGRRPGPPLHCLQSPRTSLRPLPPPPMPPGDRGHLLARFRAGSLRVAGRPRTRCRARTTTPSSATRCSQPSPPAPRSVSWPKRGAAAGWPATAAPGGPNRRQRKTGDMTGADRPVRRGARRHPAPPRPPLRVMTSFRVTGPRESPRNGHQCRRNVEMFHSRDSASFPQCPPRPLTPTRMTRNP